MPTCHARGWCPKAKICCAVPSVRMGTPSPPAPGDPSGACSTARRSPRGRRTRRLPRRDGETEREGGEHEKVIQQPLHILERGLHLCLHLLHHVRPCGRRMAPVGTRMSRSWCLGSRGSRSRHLLFGKCGSGNALTPEIFVSQMSRRRERSFAVISPRRSLDSPMQRLNTSADASRAFVGASLSAQCPGRLSGPRPIFLTPDTCSTKGREPIR